MKNRIRQSHRVDRALGMYANSCGRVKTIQKRYRADGNTFVNGEKYLQLQHAL